MDKEILAFSEKIYQIINQKSILDIKVLDVHELTTLTDCFIIATAPNVRQTQAIADELEELLDKDNIVAQQIEGYQDAKWILIDYGNVIVHILHKEEAEFYNLDRLWKDAENICFE